MAQRPRSRSGGSRRPSGGSRSGGRSGGSRSTGRGGGRGRAPARKGGSNATAIGVGVVVLLGVIAIVVISSGKKNKVTPDYQSEEVNSETVVPKKEHVGFEEPDRPPPPEISDEIHSNAKAIVEQAEVEKVEADRHYEEAMAAKEAGDEKLWQAKLVEAREHYITIKEMWNEQIVAEIQGELPVGCPYDADEVANHWIGKEAGKITKMLERLAYITKQMRMTK